MNKPMAAVLADALRLDDDARAILAAELLEVWTGLPAQRPNVPGDVEILRRVDAIESGALPLEPWDSVRRRIEKDILCR